MTKRGSGGVEQRADVVLGQRTRHPGLVRRVEPDRAQPRVAEPVHHCPHPVEVVVGDDEEFDEVPAHGDGRRCAAYAACTHKEYAHWSLRVTSSPHGPPERNLRTPCG
jgi:hypothetical protein